MEKASKKQTLTPRNPLIDAASREGGEHLLPKQRVVGSTPIARSNPYQDCISAVGPVAKRAEKADAHPLGEALEAFLLSKQVAGCTARTVSTYAWWLRRLTATVEVTPLSVRAF